MADQVLVRCCVCRSVVLLAVLWAVGECCPQCSQRLYAARRRPNRDGVPGRATALLDAAGGLPRLAARPEPRMYAIAADRSGA